MDVNSGGEVLHTLLASEYNSIKASSITCVVRSKESAEALSKLGVNVQLFTGLDETDVLADLASMHDGKRILFYQGLWNDTHQL
jgi:uroporphyrinogen-III synthase